MNQVDTTSADKLAKIESVVAGYESGEIKDKLDAFNRIRDILDGNAD